MSVVGGKALQEQLSAVLEALTRAALAEICGLVEEGYSVLQLEISRSHKENRDLKAKLHLIQSILVRGGHGESQAAAPAKEEEEEESGAAAAVAAAFRPETPSRRGDTGVEREEVPDVVLIKDEDSDGDDSLEDGERGGGAASVSEGAPSTRTARRRRRRSRAQDDDGSSALKTSRQDVPVYSLDSPGSSPPVPDGVRANSADDYAGPTDPDVQLVQDCSLAPPVLSRQAFFSGDALMEAPPPPVRSNLDLDPEWTNQPKASMTFAQFCPSDGVEADTFGLKLVGDAASSAFEYGGGVLNFGLYGGEPPDNDADAQRKRFVCSMCNKTYATAQNLEVHTRIHTGERPFACEQCGKKFTQSAHLRSHLNVHTGARPYACTLCPRSFIVKYSLKLHMKKCHPTN